MKQFKQYLLASVLALFLSVNHVYTQPVLCDSLMVFETLSADTFGLNFDNAGDLAFNDVGIDVYVDSILWTNGYKGYFWAYVDSSSCGFGAGNTIRFNNVSLIFDFSPINTKAVSFIFWDLGGDENLQVNAGPIHVVNSFSLVPPDVAPDVLCAVDTIGPDDCGWGIIGKVKLYGTINSLLIAGQELWIDSVCIDTVLTPSVIHTHQTKEYILEQNFPNPFSSVTKISYTISKPGLVNLKIYDIYGREIRELVNHYQKSDIYTINFNARDLPDGVYYYTLEVNDFISTQKMLLIR